MGIPTHIQEKLSKLLRFAEDAKKRQSQAELENAMSKVQAILTQYNVSLSQINLEEGQQEAQVEGRFNRNVDFLRPKNEGKWVLEAFWYLGKYFFVQCFTNREHTAIKIVGEPHNIEIFEYAIQFILPTIRNMGRDAWKEDRGDMTNRNAFLRGFYSAAVRGLKDKLEQELEDSASVHRVNPNDQSAALIVISQDKLAKVNAWVENNMRISRGRGTKSYGHEGAQKGYAAGQSINIRKGLNTGVSGNKLIG